MTLVSAGSAEMTTMQAVSPLFRCAEGMLKAQLASACARLDLQNHLQTDPGLMQPRGHRNVHSSSPKHTQHTAFKLTHTHTQCQVIDPGLMQSRRHLNVRGMLTQKIHKMRPQCQVIDPGLMQSRRHLNVRGKSATLPAVTDKDWLDLKFGVEVGVDYFALSFVQVGGCRPGCCVRPACVPGFRTPLAATLAHTSAAALQFLSVHKHTCTTECQSDL